MERKYIVLISLISSLLIIGTTLLYPILSSKNLIKDETNSDGKLSEALIIPDSTSGTAPLSIHFKSLLKNFNEPVEYDWDFGDGNSSIDANPSHIYEAEGTYNCTLKVSSDSIDSTDSLRITVSKNNPPMIKIIVDKTSGNRPMTVHFDVDGFDTDGEIVSYDWEILYPPILSYQKVTTHDERNFSERFLITGLYEVKLTVIDDTGNIATDYIKIQVLGHQIELMVKGGLFYISQITSGLRVFNFIKDLFVDDEPQTFFERVRLFLEAMK